MFKSHRVILLPCSAGEAQATHIFYTYMAEFEIRISMSRMVATGAGSHGEVRGCKLLGRKAIWKLQFIENAEDKINFPACRDPVAGALPWRIVDGISARQVVRLSA